MKALSYLITIAITASLAGGGVYLWQNEKDEVQPRQIETQASEATMGEISEPIISETLQMDFPAVNTKEDEIRAEFSKQVGEKSQLHQTSFVQHPTKKNVVIIAYSQRVKIANDPSVKSTSRFYYYDVNTSEVHKFYEEILPDQFNKHTIIGLQGSKLVTLRMDDFSPGPCYPWRRDTQLTFIELSDIKNGFQNYTTPQYLIDEEALELEGCIET